MSDQIPVLTVWSNNYKVLYDRMENTLPKSFKLLSKKIDIIDDGYGFGKKSFYQAIEKKILYIVEYLRSEKEGKVVLASDSDIFFTRDTDELYKIGLDMCKTCSMVFMREGRQSQVNGGFYFIRNSKEIQDFLKKAADSVIGNIRHSGGDADQLFFNEELPRAPFKWAYFPPSKMIWGWELVHAQEALFHHAVCCGTVSEKIAQQNIIADSLKITL